MFVAALTVGALILAETPVPTLSQLQDKLWPGEAIREAPRLDSEYVREQLAWPGGPIDPPPAKHAQYLAEHADLLRVVRAAAQDSIPRGWQEEVHQSRSRGYRVLFSLRSAFLADALERARGHEPGRALESLTAAARIDAALGRSLFVDLGFLIQVASLLRRIDSVPLEAADRILPADLSRMAFADQRRHLAELQRDVVLEIEGSINVRERALTWCTTLDDWWECATIPAGWLQQQRWRACSGGIIEGLPAYLDVLAGASPCERRDPTWRRDAAGEVFSWYCRPREQDYYDFEMGRLATAELQIELTRIVLAVREVRERTGLYPAEPPAGLATGCGGERWSYEITPECKLAVAVAYRMDDHPDTVRLEYRE